MLPRKVIKARIKQQIKVTKALQGAQIGAVLLDKCVAFCLGYHLALTQFSQQPIDEEEIMQQVVKVGCDYMIEETHEKEA